MAYLKAEGRDSEQTDGKVIDETVALLEKHRHSPFFIAAGLYRPHIPYIAPKKYFEMYDLEKTPLPFVPKNYRATVPSAALASTPRWPNFNTAEQQARECILAYDACVSFIDAQIGRLMTEVDRLGLRENTLIVLWGDHGYHLGEHGLWRKNSLFEESMRAPLIFAGPGVAIEAKGCSAIVEFLDMYPTIVDLLGIEPPENLEGVSLRPLLENPNLKWNRPAFSQVQFRETHGRAVRTDRWRYVEWGENGNKGTELYDQVVDPMEMKNLAGEPGHAETMAGLSKLLRK